MSLVESLANVVVGFGVACAANWLVLPWFGFRPSVTDTLAIGAIMTGISIARSYALRRVFEALRVRREVRAMVADIASMPLRVVREDDVHGDVPHVPDRSRPGRPKPGLLP